MKRDRYKENQVTGKEVFSSSNPFGFPDLHRDDLGGLLQKNPVAKDYRESSLSSGDLVHFFMDDHRFESVWSRPWESVNRLRAAGVHLICSPDFTIFPGMPSALQFYQVYRSRWLGRYYQEHGFSMIPSINWSDPLSFQWCFMGLPRGGWLAVEVPADDGSFLGGFDAMMRALSPVGLVVFGSLPYDPGVPVYRYPRGHWGRKRAA